MLISVSFRIRPWSLLHQTAFLDATRLSVWLFDLILLLSKNRTALRFAEASCHEEVACILRVDPAVSTIQESAAAGRIHEVWALMRQVDVYGADSLLKIEHDRCTEQPSVFVCWWL